MKYKSKMRQIACAQAEIESILRIKEELKELHAQGSEQDFQVKSLAFVSIVCGISNESFEMILDLLKKESQDTIGQYVQSLLKEGA